MARDLRLKQRLLEQTLKPAWMLWTTLESQAPQRAPELGLLSQAQITHVEGRGTIGLSEEKTS